MNPAKPPINDPAPGLRQRWRARSKDWRVWWEPSAAQRRAGLDPVELDGTRPTWSNREADKLSKRADQRLQKTEPLRRRAKSPGAASIDALVTAYLNPHNRLFHKNSEKHQKNVRYDITRILDVWSGAAVKNLTKPVIYTWYETLYAEHGPRMAQRLIGTLSTLLSYATLRGMIDVNPALRMGMETPPPRNRLVSWPEYDALIGAAAELGEISIDLCIALSMFMGQRETDCWQVQVGDFIRHALTPGGKPVLCWRIIRSKDRKNKVSHLPVHPDVLVRVQAAIGRRRPAGDVLRPAPADACLVLQDRTGNAMTEDYFQKAFARVRDHAALTLPSVATVQFRDLRRTFSNNSRHAGMGDSTVDDALGNTAGTDPRLRQTYMPASDQLAADAIMAVQRPQIKAKRKRA